MKEVLILDEKVRTFKIVTKNVVNLSLARPEKDLNRRFIVDLYWPIFSPRNMTQQKNPTQSRFYIQSGKTACSLSELPRQKL